MEYASAAVALTRDHGFPSYAAWALILRGWALVSMGRNEEGIGLIHQGLRDHEATGAALGRPSLLGLLADAYGKTGQPEAGQRVLADALSLVANTGERFDEATLNRLQGELMILALPEERVMASAEIAAAQACFLRAIGIAQQQEAKSIELQAVLSLARLWHSQGDSRTARQMLARIHGSFTEGIDTVDSCQAKELLQNLPKATRR